MPMHFGLTDMALFRFARKSWYGLASATGMLMGHMGAWICSGIMIAAVNREMHPGMMAFEAVGWAGPLAVAIAGWTTANPTLYRAGLALQAASPNWPRWKVTAAAGLAMTTLACFPLFVNRLNDMVALNGIFLMPIGAIVLAEHWIFPRLGLEQYQAEKQGCILNWRALAVWAGAVVFCLVVLERFGVHLFFRSLPGYLLALAAYVALTAAFSKKAMPAARPAMGD
jgi:purine-cytosine permease-like protein